MIIIDFSFQVEFNYQLSKQTTIEEACQESCWADSSESAASTNAGTFSWVVSFWWQCLSLVFVFAFFNNH